MQRKITIAIDGYSSTGKSTVAKQLAKHLNYIYVDTGAMYRAVTLYALENNIISQTDFHKEALKAALNNINLSFVYNKDKGYGEIFLNGVNVENDIRSLNVSEYVSSIATISEVRQKLVKQQQEFGKDKGVVMDGRDIGTVVFPDADLKVFMTANAKERAQRRYNELIDRGDDVTYAEIYNNVVERDKIDTTRKDSPLKKAPDAIEIDNSYLTLEDQFHTLLQLAKDRIANR